jgi:sigma-54 dependent transcriptional regulator, acetoin dehydrogenase operon transcriptional activator AcoR
MNRLTTSRSETHVQWRKFSQTGCTERVRETIKASWLRCRELGLDPVNRKSVGTVPKVYDSQTKGRDMLRNLLATRCRDMEVQFEFSPFVLLFASASGHLMSICGNERIIEKFYDLGVVEGVNVNEKFSGTNAPALCLAEQKPSTVLAAEHYFKEFHWAECIAAPVFDYHRRFLGCLGLTTTFESHMTVENLAEYFGWLATTMTVELFVEEKLRELDIQDSFFRSTFEHADQVLLLVDREGNMLHMNLAGQRLLGAFHPGAARKNFREVLQLPHGDRPLAFFFKAQHLVRPLAPARTDEALLMETIPLVGQSGDERAYLLKISQIKRRVSAAPAPDALVPSLTTFEHLIAEDPASLTLVEKMQKAARTSSSILIEGETGTGKELFARAIHSASAYRNGPFVAINCSAVPHELVESELYGYERGAYTGARRDGNIGKFEAANCGTIFLDEIQSMPTTAQIKLLRVLEERELTRIGGHKPIRLDFRVIAASSADLRREAGEGDLLDALYFRLSVVNFRILPLRERRRDIPPLVTFFIHQMNAKFGRSIKGIDEDLLALFARYKWPGNVRELRNCLEYAFNFCDGEIITMGDMGEQLADFNETGNRQEKPLERITKRLMMDALKTHGTISKASASLGISVSTFYRKMKKFGLSD